MFWHLFLLMVFPINLWAGGSFSGGEDGVVCFADANTADAAVENGILKAEFKSKVRNIYAAEYWEGAAAENPCNARIKFKNHRTPAGPLSAESMVQFALFHLGIYRPNLVQRLDEIETLIAFDGWESVQAVEPINDSEIREGNNCHMSSVPKVSNCRVVQLARRDKTGPKQYRITFDSELYGKMDQLNQAMVQLHERIYLLGALLGHQRSEYTRFLVMTLFEDRVAGEARSFGAALLAGGFGLYAELLDLLPHQPPPISEDSRIRSYERLYKLLLEWSDQQKISPYEALTRRYADFIDSMLRTQTLSDEMALMFYASMSSPKFDDLIDRRLDQKRTWQGEVQNFTALEKACVQTQLDYSIAFQALKAYVNMGQGSRWAIPRWSELALKIEKMAQMRGNLNVLDGACEMASEGKGPEAHFFSRQCLLRRKAMSYCQGMKIDSRTELEKSEGQAPPFSGVRTIRGDVWKKRQAPSVLEPRATAGERQAYVSCHRHITEVKMQSFAYSYWCQREAGEKSWVLYANHPLDYQIYYFVKSWSF